MNTLEVKDFPAQDYTILVIDDNPTNLKVVSTYLKEKGFKVMVARQGQVGLQRAEDGLPDLILLDILMPEMDGFEVCRRLKENGKTQDIPVIYMTALTDEQDKVKGFEMGAVDYVTKPFHNEEVMARVVTHLKVRELTRRLQQVNQHLQQEKDMLRSTLEALAHPFYVVDAQDYTVKLANSAVHRLGKQSTCYALTHKLDTPCHKAGLSCPLEIAKKTKEPVVVEHLLSDSTGNTTIVELHGYPIMDETGNITQMIEYSLDITARKRTEVEREHLQQELIETQQHAIQELSTPIIPIMDGIIVMPLIGNIDTIRSRDITRALLAGISRYRAKVVILDITGVPVVDSGVAAHLNKTTKAAQLKGARTIVTGISDVVAEIMVDLGIDWGEVETLHDLQTGLVSALKGLSLKLVREKNLLQDTKSLRGPLQDMKRYQQVSSKPQPIQ